MITIQSRIQVDRIGGMEIFNFLINPRTASIKDGGQERILSYITVHNIEQHWQYRLHGRICWKSVE